MNGEPPGDQASAPASLFEFGLFSGVPQHDHFNRVAELLTTTVPAASTPRPWPEGEPLTLPGAFEFQGQQRPTQAFLDDTDTAALLVLQDGRTRLETYALTGGPEVTWISMSVAKSFVSALVGIAVEEGHITSIDDALSAYVPVAPGSAYDGVPISQVLEMSSGARWNEDYHDAASDIYRLMAAMGVDGSLDDFVATMAPDAAPGTVCRYNSGDTQALGSLIRHATGHSLTDYLHSRLFEPLGVETPGHWLVDAQGTEVAFAGLAMTARDYARLGELYRNGGTWHGRTIVPSSWVAASTRADVHHRRPGQPFVGSERFAFGYGYQWWIPAGDRGDYTAIGVYNQFIHVDPASRCVIVKLSANRAYGTSTSEATNRESETLALFRAIVAAAEHDRTVRS